MNKISDRSLKYLSFIQAFSLLAYISGVALFMNNAEKMFGKIDAMLGPILFLTIFSTSALICGYITFYFPFVIFWHRKQSEQAIRLVFYLIRWLLLFTALIIGLIILSK